VECHECPVGYIDPHWAHLVRTVGRGWWVRELTGVPALPSDQSRWPATLVDALEILSVERQRVESAETSAMLEPNQ
jgi:hypothetical protein